MRRNAKLWALGVTVTLLTGTGGSGLSNVAKADVFTPGMDGMPTQAQTDLASTDPANTMHSPGWADLAGGVAARPYVSSLSVTNGGVTTPVVVGGSTVVPTLSDGDLTAVVSPFNLCPAGAAAQNGCYATPNRVGLTLGYVNHDANGHNFGAPAVPLVTPVDADTVIDLTVALNSLGKNLSWTWVNGDLLSWQTSDLGRDDASVHIRFRPAPTPFVSMFPANNGCTATPIFNCEVPRADADQLSASMVFSLDGTLDPALAGAVFATRNAFYGFLSPTGSPNKPVLDIQLASSHLKADGSPQLGTLQAFLPASTLLSLYGILPADAGAVFTTTRAGDLGGNAAPTYTPWTVAGHGSDGVLVTVDDITFSAPRYRVAAKAYTVAVKATSAKGKTTVLATVPACNRKVTCAVVVYDLGPAKVARFALRRVLVIKSHLVTARSLALSVASSKLPRGHRFLLVVHATRSHKLIASTVGTVK